MDLMSRAVDQLRLRRADYGVRTSTAPWSHKYAAGEAAVHVVLRGDHVLRQQREQYALCAGDLVILPRGAAHELSSAPASTRADSAELLSGSFEFESPDHPLLGVLPAVIHATPARLGSNARCALYLQQLIDEARSERDGASALAARLTEVLFIEVMRFFTPPPGVECPVGGWFSGLSDPAVRRALAAIHEQPGSAWTVDALAKLAGQSRSAFAAHFNHVMRETPAAYLTRWRMFQSRQLLRQSELPLDEIARRVGYGSAAAFSLAFVREHGTPPGAYRRTNGAHAGGAATAQPTLQQAAGAAVGPAFRQAPGRAARRANTHPLKR